MAGNGNAADFGQMLIYHDVTAIGAEKGETDRCSLVDQLKLRGGAQSFCKIHFDLNARHIAAPLY
jgi:hypothetical protein